MAQPSPPKSFNPFDSLSAAPTESADDEELTACVLSFNANDPSGASGLAADVLAIACVGAHPMPITTGVYVRDTAEILEFFPLDEDAVESQARAVLEDVAVQIIKVGFLGTPEAITKVAEITADYDDVPVVAYMPSLSWWTDAETDSYLDAFTELMLPQTTVLVGNHSTLWRWLLPDWSSERSPSARDLANAASSHGVAYTLVTGIPLPDQYIDNVLATPEAVLGGEKFERFEATFIGAGETLSAALAALLANGDDLVAATKEALVFLDRSLDSGFRPGMGQVVPDRMFWAQPEEEPLPLSEEEKQLLQTLDMPTSDTKH
ncbi:MAG: bifunctional hydroxymethylpyrimidine kinase/phosphomethylpyrimidine kinase, partial [Burkholderiaceae bacterium]